MLAVTTRNWLKSPRCLIPMLVARQRVREQVGRTLGLIRWADAITGPLEFCAPTVWADQSAVVSFKSSDAHREPMWRCAQWSAAFRSMCWHPRARRSRGTAGGWRVPAD